MSFQVPMLAITRKVDFKEIINANKRALHFRCYKMPGGINA